MTDIRAFLTAKQVPEPNGDVEEEQDEVSWEVPVISRVQSLVPERQGVLPSNVNNVVERNVDRAAQERLMLLETLNQLKEEELYWSKLVKEDASKASFEEDAIERVMDHTRTSSQTEPEIVLPPSLYSVRPLVGQNDSVLNMFHGLMFTSPVASRVSQSLMSYKFNGVSAVRMKRPASLLKFVCQLNVNSLDNSVDAFSLDVTSPFTAKKELNGFLTACKRDKDISRALYGLSSYSELLIKRYSVFENISSTYTLSKDSTWPMGHTLAFPDTGAQLFISWKINLGEDNLVAEATSTIQAFVRPSQALLSHDKAGTFSQINNIFTSLIEEHGVLHAISTLHDILYS